MKGKFMEDVLDKKLKRISKRITNGRVESMVSWLDRKSKVEFENSLIFWKDLKYLLYEV